jgi:hypothetical protein
MSKDQDEETTETVETLPPMSETDKAELGFDGKPAEDRKDDHRRVVEQMVKERNGKPACPR